MRREAPDLVAAQVEHVHRAAFGAEREELHVRREARGRVRREDLGHRAAEALVLEGGLLLGHWCAREDDARNWTSSTAKSAGDAIPRMGAALWCRSGSGTSPCRKQFTVQYPKLTGRRHNLTANAPVHDVRLPPLSFYRPVI